ncbi:hypothetical protein JL720_16880 [Aureococcus anophagefferens]|nr:hypothetical protein JL720_16880 [Aureococcus anophagefferens]
MASGDAQGGKKGSGDGEMKEPEWMVKKREFEKVKARAKALKLRLTCRLARAGHKKVCKEIRARAEAPTPPSPQRDVV